MKDENELAGRLATHRTRAPEGFAERVMAGVPAWRARRREGILRRHARWVAPALAGACAALLAVSLFGRFKKPAAPPQVSFHFELHAPGADRVELLGTFNEWKMGDIVLDGPDASGHWTATVELLPGRYEYVFLVDGERWIADPRGALHRPDGFGHVNTVLRINDENSA